MDRAAGTGGRSGETEQRGAPRTASATGKDTLEHVSFIMISHSLCRLYIIPERAEAVAKFVT